jgi:hypothetical protein
MFDPATPAVRKLAPTAFIERYQDFRVLLAKRTTAIGRRHSIRIPHRFSQHGVQLALGEFTRLPFDWLPRY